MVRWDPVDETYPSGRSCRGSRLPNPFDARVVQYIGYEGYDSSVWHFFTDAMEAQGLEPKELEAETLEEAQKEALYLLRSMCIFQLGEIEEALHKEDHGS